MKKSLKRLTILLATVSAISLISPISTSATTKDDVIAVARQVGMPENLVQSYIALGADIEVTSAQCDKAISMLYNLYGTTNSKIEDDFGVDMDEEPSQNQDEDNNSNNNSSQVDTDNTSISDNNSNINNDSNSNNIVTTKVSDSGEISNANTTTTITTTTTTDTTSSEGNVTVIENNNTTQDITSNNDNNNYQAPIDEQEFISMTYDEKIEFVNSLPDDEQSEFMNNLSLAERNSIIKQMNLDSKTEIVNAIVDAGKSMGYNFSIDELSEDKISLSMRDEEGTLIGVTDFGGTVDNTGKNYTGLVLSMLAIIGLSGFGLVKISKKVGSI